MDLEIIRKMSEKRDGGLKRLAADVGMSEQNLHRCIRNNKIQASDLEKIAMLLDVDIKVFFSDGENKTGHTNTVLATGDHSGASVTGNVTISGESNVSVLQERISSLEKLLDEKERTIQILMRGK